MSAADVVLFSLSFLAFGLLAGWVRSLSRERDRFPQRVPVRVRDPELGRVSGSLESALARIESLERRNEALERRNEALARLVHGRVAVAGTDPAEPGAAEAVPGEQEVSPSQWRSAMDRLGPVWPSGSRSADAVPRSTAVEPSADEPSLAVEPPADAEHPADTEPPADTEHPADPEHPADTEPPADAEHPADTEPAGRTSPWSSLSSAALTATVRRGAPLDDLFPPPGAVGALPPGAGDGSRNGTAREPGGPGPS